MASPPGEKDILFGRGRTVFQHLANQTFRKYIDLHIEDYVRCERRQEKSNMVRDIFHDLYNSGYRFMKPKEDHTFIEIDRTHALGKVGHALRDRSALLEKITLESQKTRRELKRDGFSVLRYAELLIRGQIPPLRRRRTAADLKRIAAYKAAANNASSNSERNTAYQQQQAAAAASINSRQEDGAAAARNAAAMDFMSKATAAVDITNEYGNSEQQQQQQAQHLASGAMFFPQSTMRHSSNQNGLMRGQNIKAVKPPSSTKKKTLNDIVVPAMKSGNLPYGGYWKFFPLPEVQKSIDLEPLRGWKLILKPVSFVAPTIFLDVE